MNRRTSLFKDDDSSGFEREHYSCVKAHYRGPEYIVYPNVALQVIINADAPNVKAQLDPDPKWLSTENFFYTSSVDLCVIRTSDYLPFVAFEVDGESHDKPRQKEKDKFKTLLFEKAGIPLCRLAVHWGQSETQRRNQLDQAISSVSSNDDGPLEAQESLKNKRSILAGTNIRGNYDFLNRIFYSDGCVVLPNLALQSIFADRHVRDLPAYAERDLCKSGLVDFCIVGVPDFRPIVAFSIIEDALKSKLFNSFGLPLLHLQKG